MLSNYRDSFSYKPVLLEYQYIYQYNSFSENMCGGHKKTNPRKCRGNDKLTIGIENLKRRKAVLLTNPDLPLVGLSQSIAQVAQVWYHTEIYVIGYDLY